LVSVLLQSVFRSHSNDGLLGLSARTVNETVTASSVFSYLFTPHVLRLRPGRRRTTTTTRTKCSVQLIKRDIPVNYLEHAPLHDRLITIDHYRLTSVSYSQCHQCKASFPCPFFTLVANHALTPSIEMPVSSRAISYYVLEGSPQNLVSMALRERVHEFSKNLEVIFTFQGPGG